MASKEEKRMQLELLKMQKESLALQNKAFEASQKEDPNLAKLRNHYGAIVDWNTGANGVKDIRNHPTLAMKMPVFQAAMKNRDAGRIGRGIAAIGQNSDSPYSESLRLEDDFRRNMMAAGNLEAGLAGEFDAAQAGLGNVVGQETSRMLSGIQVGANSASQMGQMINRLDQRIAASGGSFLGKIGKGLLKYGVPMVTTALTGGAGGGSFLSGLFKSTPKFNPTDILQ